MRKIFAFIVVLIAILMLNSCIGLTGLIGELTYDGSENQTSMEQFEQSSELPFDPSVELSSDIESTSAVGISMLSDEELEIIASDIVNAWEEYENYGIICQREDIANYNDIEPYLTEDQRETYVSIEKCICCKTKEEAKKHLERYLDLTNIYADPPEGYSADYMYSLTDDLLCEHDGELYWIMPAKGSVGYDTDNMVINRIDENTFSATVDMYGSGANYCDTYEFWICYNGDNYVAFYVSKVSGPIVLSNIDEKIVLPENIYELSTGEEYYVNADGGLNMRYGPGENYEKIMLIPNGAEVLMRDTFGGKIDSQGNWSGGWCFIEYNGQFGWVAEEFIEYKY